MHHVSHVLVSSFSIHAANPNQEQLQLDYYSNHHPDQVVVVVGGSSDTRGILAPLMQQLSLSMPTYDFVTFSFRGLETGNNFELGQQAIDLTDVMDFLTANNQQVWAVVCTSQGAYSTCRLVTNGHLRQPIRHLIMLDPADYSTDPHQSSTQAETRSGHQPEPLSQPTVSGLLQSIASQISVDVIHLPIRNYGKAGYIAPPLRGHDNPGYFPRLNTDMVKRFFSAVPLNNRGQYIELATVPHAFMRDGDVSQNIRAICELLKTLLGL